MAAVHWKPFDDGKVDSIIDEATSYLPSNFLLTDATVSAPLTTNNASPTLSEYYKAASAVYADNAIGTSWDNQPPAPLGFTLLLDSRDPSLVGNTNWLSDGFFGQAFKDASGNVIIAFEGAIIDPADPSFSTPYGAGSRVAAVDTLIGLVPQAFQDAINFSLDVSNLTGSNPIYLTGHSLGGAEAEAVAYIHPNNIAIGGGVTFGAQGIPELRVPVPNPNFTNYVDYGDPIGNYGNHFGSVVHVGSPFDKVVTEIFGPLVGIALYHPLSHYGADLHIV
jgi:hypothetical protein